MDFKREYENYGKRLENNKKKIKELHELKQQINDEISKLEEESRLLLDRKLNMGLKICQMEGHVGNWQNSHIEGINVVCTCDRCKSKAIIKL